LLRCEFSLDLVDEVQVEIEKAAQEPDHQQLVLAFVREEMGAALGLVEAGDEVGDVLADCPRALARRRFADEVADQ
jgi:hypothetical protein